MKKFSDSESDQTNHKCPICGNKTIKTSRTKIVDRWSKIDWVSDSTFELSGLKTASTGLSTCFKCFHTYLLPVFDTSRLYQSDLGYLTRKKVFEEYNPSRDYDNNNDDLTAQLLFTKSSNEN